MIGRAWRAWRLARRMPWLTYRQAWRCCVGTVPPAIVGNVPDMEPEGQ